MNKDKIWVQREELFKFQFLTNCNFSSFHGEVNCLISRLWGSKRTTHCLAYYFIVVRFFDIFNYFQNIYTLNSNKIFVEYCVYILVDSVNAPFFNIPLLLYFMRKMFSKDFYWKRFRFVYRNLLSFATTSPFPHCPYAHPPHKKKKKITRTHFLSLVTSCLRKFICLLDIGESRGPFLIPYLFLSIVCMSIIVSEILNAKVFSLNRMMKLGKWWIIDLVIIMAHGVSCSVVWFWLQKILLMLFQLRLHIIRWYQMLKKMMILRFPNICGKRLYV